MPQPVAAPGLWLHFTTLAQNTRTAAINPTQLLPQFQCVFITTHCCLLAVVVVGWLPAWPMYLWPLAALLIFHYEFMIGSGNWQLATGIVMCLLAKASHKYLCMFLVFFLVLDIGLT